MTWARMSVRIGTSELSFVSGTKLYLALSGRRGGGFTEVKLNQLYPISKSCITFLWASPLLRFQTSDNFASCMKTHLWMVDFKIVSRITFESSHSWFTRRCHSGLQKADIEHRLGESDYTQSTTLIPSFLWKNISAWCRGDGSWQKCI
jgi:hypothetical protein